MPLRETAPIGAPCWIDLFTTDPDKSRAFYGELFGWKAAGTEPPSSAATSTSSRTTSWSPAAMHNDGSSGTTRRRGRCTSRSPTRQRPSTPRPRTAARSSFPAMAVGDLGTMAVVTDPGGARIGIWQPGLHKGFGIFDEPSTPGWFELHTRDYDASVAFYRDVFGGTRTRAQRHARVPLHDTRRRRRPARRHHGRRRVPARRSCRRAGRSTSASTTPTRRWRRIVDLGGTVVEPAQDTPYGRLATATDSTGARFKLMAGN